VRWVARRLDGHVLAVDPGRKRTFGNEIVEHSVEERGILGVKRHCGASIVRNAARHLGEEAIG
jgi:hypothetical protein